MGLARFKNFFLFFSEPYAHSVCCLYDTTRVIPKFLDTQTNPSHKKQPKWCILAEISDDDDITGEWSETKLQDTGNGEEGWLIDDYDWPMETWLPTSRSFFFRYLERWALSRKNILTANNYWSIANVNNGVCTSTVNPCMPQDCSSWFQLLVPIYDIYIGKEASRGVKPRPVRRSVDAETSSWQSLQPIHALPCLDCLQGRRVALSNGTYCTGENGTGRCSNGSDALIRIPWGYVK